MLVRDAAVPGGERIKVLDFGIAKLSPAEGKGPTRTGSLMGTLVYISPEQCLSAARVDGRADVYSLGCMLYELTVGNPPFLADSEPALITMHLHTVPKLLSEVAPQTPEGLSALVARMLIKSREERPTMKEVAAALAALSPGMVNDTTGPAETADVFATTMPRGQLPRSVRRSTGGTVLTAAIGGAALLLCLGIGGGFYYGRRLASQELARTPPGPAQVPAVSQPAMVQWRLTSEPADAEVVRDYDQQRLGSTPWLHAQLPSRERLLLVLRKAGYRSLPVQIDLSASGTRNVVLEREPSASPSPAAPPDASPAPLASAAPKADPPSAAQPASKSSARPKLKATRNTKDLPIVE